MRDLLTDYVAHAATNIKAATIVGASTVGIGMAAIIEALPAIAGFIITILGMLVPATVIYTSIRRDRREEREIKIKEERLKMDKSK